jgi:hypothetical protein
MRGGGCGVGSLISSAGSMLVRWRLRAPPCFVLSLNAAGPFTVISHQPTPAKQVGLGDFDQNGVLSAVEAAPSPN